MDRAPVFVKIDEYKDIADIVALMREKISQARSVLDRIREVKSNEDAEILNWARELDEVDAKVVDIDRTLMEPQR